MLNALSPRGRVAIGWNILEEITSKSAGLIATVFFAYLLTPKEFGLMASIAVFVAMSKFLVDGGFGDAIVREKSEDDITLSSVFWVNILGSAVIYSLLFLAAPILDSIYSSYEITHLIRVTLIAMVFHSLTIVPSALLRRRLDFYTKFKVQSISSILSCIGAVGVAFLGWERWALPSQIVFHSILSSLLFFFFIDWFPKPIFSLAEVKRLFKFSKYVIIDTFFGILNNNLYLMIFPLMFSSGLLGLYYFWEKLKNIYVTVFMSSIFKVIYPILSRAKNTNVELEEDFRKIFILIINIITPITLFVILVSPPLFQHMFPAKWISGVTYLQLMLFTALLHPLHSLSNNLLLAQGRSDLSFKIGLLKKINVLLTFGLTHSGGISAVLIGHFFASTVNYGLHLPFNKRSVGYAYRTQIADLFVCFAGWSSLFLFFYFMLGFSFNFIKISS